MVDNWLTNQKEAEWMACRARVEVDVGMDEGLDAEMKEALDAIDLDRQDVGMDEGLDAEMKEALDAIDLDRQDEMDWIKQQLKLLERFQDKTAYYMYPMVWDGGVIVLDEPLLSFGIKEALHQFEEDFDYEESLVQV
jgi:hypothetical protein